MSATITGRAHVHGLRGAITYTGIATNAAGLLQSAAFAKSARVQDSLYDPDSTEEIGKARGGIRIAGEIDFIPVADAAGNTISNAKLALKMPDPPFMVTLTSFDHADLNEKYICDGPVRVAFTPDGKARVTMPIYRNTAGDNSTTHASSSTVLTTAAS